MKFLLTTFLTLLISTIALGQSIDTLTFHSNAFDESRTVYVHKSEFYKYKSDSVRLPVIYLLDGQHDWFINPVLSDIKYLQYTHQIPDAIVVVIPHQNRVKECGIISLEKELPLDRFITQDLDEKLKDYYPNNFRVIVGHSFSASFSLYSYYNHPEYYSAVIANSPLDEMDLLVNGFNKSNTINKHSISISIGGIAKHLDYHHRKKYNQLKLEFPSFFTSISTFEANYSSHSTVPIVATPTFLTRIFNEFSSRYVEIAPVDMEYKLINEPESIEIEIQNIMQASKIGNYFYPPEIPDINGIASRYWNSGYENYAIKVYELGIEYYPNDFDSHLSLYDLYLNVNQERAHEYLNKAERLLNTIEPEGDEREEILEEIKTEKVNNGWEP